MVKPVIPGERDYTVEGTLIPVGYQQITALDTVQGLTPPQGARVALVQGLSQNIRWRDDKTDPTSSVGMRLIANNDFLYVGDLVKIKFIEEAASAELNVTYYA